MRKEKPARCKRCRQIYLGRRGCNPRNAVMDPEVVGRMEAGGAIQPNHGGGLDASPWEENNVRLMEDGRPDE